MHLFYGQDSRYPVMGEWDGRGCAGKYKSAHQAAITGSSKAELSCLLGNVGAAMLRDIHKLFDPIDSILREAPAKAFMISVSTDGSKWSQDHAADGNVLTSTQVAVLSIPARS